MNVWDQLKNRFKSGNSIFQLILVNSAFFLIFKFIDVFLFLFRPEGRAIFNPINYLMLPADLSLIAERPWTLITNMFLHADFFHVLFNMLWLYWFGLLFANFIGNKKVIPLYFVGGLGGGLLYILAFNTLPAFADTASASFALGASAAVIAIVVAVATYAPKYSISLLFIGQVQLRYIAIFTVIIDILSIPSMNSGGHIAHLGGAAIGFVYGWQYAKGKNIFRFLEHFIDWILHPRPVMKVKKSKSSKNNVKHMNDYDYNYQKKQSQAEIDAILDKIAKSGYDSLTRKEKDTLFNSGK